MLPGFGAPDIVPPYSSMTRSPLPSAGSLGQLSQRSLVIWVTPTPQRPSRLASVVPSLSGTGASRDARKRWGLLRSWGTSVRSPPSQTPVGPLRLAFEDDLRCGELLFAGGFRHLAGASVLTIVAFSPPRGAPVPPALVEQRRLPTTISLSKLNHAALTLAVYASQLSFPLSRSYGHARLASGWWPTFTGRGSRPRKVPNEVSASSTWHPPHPSFATQARRELGSQCLPLACSLGIVVTSQHQFEVTTESPRGEALKHPPGVDGH